MLRSLENAGNILIGFGQAAATPSGRKSEARAVSAEMGAVVVTCVRMSADGWTDTVGRLQRHEKI